MQFLSGKQNANKDCALILLFWSDRALEVDFNSDAFKILFDTEKDLCDDENWTVLMCICYKNPDILENDLWFIPELLKQAP